MLDAFPWAEQLSPPRQKVLTEMLAELGIDGLTGIRDFLFSLRSGDYASAANAMLESPGSDRSEEWAEIILNDS